MNNDHDIAVLMDKAEYALVERAAEMFKKYMIQGHESLASLQIEVYAWPQNLDNGRLFGGSCNTPEMGRYTVYSFVNHSATKVVMTCYGKWKTVDYKKFKPMGTKF